jgi:AraC-like DNA-binding protein
LPDALSLVAMGRHDGLAQLKRCGAQDGAVHGTGIQVAGTSVERRKADDNSNRQNPPHNQNLTRFPARRQLHKQGAVLADDDEVTNSAFFVALHMSHFGPSRTSRDVGRSEFIYSVRLDHAAQLLQRRALLGTRPSLGEIGYACGFSDYTHFARKFRHRFGHPPGNH